MPVIGFPDRSTDFTVIVTGVPDAAFTETMFVTGTNKIERMKIIPNNE